MKTMMLIAALSLGTAAIAQDSSMQPGATAPAPGTAPTTSMPSNTPDQQQPGTMSTTPAPSTMPSGGTDSSSMGSSNSSMGSAPTTTAPAADTSTPQQPTTDYPTCSRTVTDKCVQKGGMGRKMRRK